MSFDLGSVVAHIKADISDFKSGITTAQESIKSFKDKTVDGLESVRNTALVVSGAITAVGYATLKLGEHAGKYESIRDAFTGMTKDMGFTVDEFEKKVADASKGTIDNLTILTGANKAMSLIGKESFNDFGNDFAHMAELSKKAARATGQDVGFMFDSLITGVARSSKMILDNLGISIDLSQAYDAYAQKLGVTAKELDAQQQKTALLNAVMTQLDETYKDVAVSGGGYSGALQALNTQLENAKIEIGLAVIPILNELVRTITPLVVEYTPKLIKLIQDLVTWFQNLDPKMQQIIVAFIALAPVVVIVTQLILTLIPVISALLSPIGLVVIAVIGLAAAIYYNWDQIKKFFQDGYNYVRTTLSNAVSFISGWGGSLIDALTKPFREAWDKISEFVNKIKDALDFTKRHSPSVLDIVNSSVKKVNDALDGLSYTANIVPAHASVPAMTGPSGSVNPVSVNISLDGALISDERGAMAIGEKIGDSIIKKLQYNLRF